MDKSVEAPADRPGTTSVQPESCCRGMAAADKAPSAGGKPLAAIDAAPAPPPGRSVCSCGRR